MTPIEIRDALREAFPGRHVSFEIEVNAYLGALSDDDDLPPVEMNIWSTQTGFIRCASLNEGISAMKVQLGQKIPEMELTV